MIKSSFYILAAVLLVSCSTLENQQKPKFSENPKPFTGSILVDSKGNILKSRNEDYLFIPASLLKLYHFPLFSTIKNDSAFLSTTFTVRQNGDSTVLSIYSNGDPLLNWDEIDSVSHLIHLQFPVISTVKIFTLNYDSTEFWGQGWMYDDEPADYQTFLTAFPVDENAVSVEYKRVNGIDSVRISGPKPNIVFNNLPFRIFRNPNNQIVISRPDSQLNITNVSRQFSFRKTNQLIADEIKNRFNARHAEFAENMQYDTGDSVFTLKVSHTFDQLMNKIYTESSNFASEQTVRYIGLKTKGIGSIKNGLLTEKEMRPNPIFRIADGSGLSRYSIISISPIKEIMDTLSRSENNKTWFAEYSKTGTLDDRSPLSPDIKIYGKSGSMSGIQNIAGFVYKNDVYLGYFIIFKNNTTESKVKRYEKELEQIREFIEDLSKN